MRDISTKAFLKAMDEVMAKEVDFILISGDLFNTAIPSIDHLKLVVSKLKEAKDRDMPVYMIAGSHDYSASGKTMLDVLNEAELIQNVVKGSVEEGKLKLKFTIDPKTGAKITGMLGKKGALETKYYEQLDKGNLEAEQGFKIFMFHTAIAELKPKDLEQMEAYPLSYLPKNFEYYAGGHVHYIFRKEIPDYGMITYPGALFPANFKELEKYGCGGYYIYDEGELSWHEVRVFYTESITINCEHKNPKEVEETAWNQFKDKDVESRIITIRLEGTLREGSITDINFKELYAKIYERGAYFIMRNMNKLKSPAFEELKVNQGSTEEIEESIAKEHAGQIRSESIDCLEEIETVKIILKALNTEKIEGETVPTFQNRIKEEMARIFRIDGTL